MFEPDLDSALHSESELESPWEREMGLLRAAGSGFIDRAKTALSSEETNIVGIPMPHFAYTGLEIATSFGAGAGLRIMSTAGGPWAALSKATLVAGGLGFGVDALSRLGTAAGAAIDTWNSTDSYDRNKKLVGEGIGFALFDYPLIAASGLWGAKAPEFGAKLGYTGLKSGYSSLSGALSESPLTAGLQTALKKLEMPELNNMLPGLKRALGIKDGRNPMATDAPTTSRSGEPYASLAEAIKVKPMPYTVRFSEYDGKPVQIKVYPPGKAQEAFSATKISGGPGFSLGGFHGKQVMVPLDSTMH